MTNDPLPYLLMRYTSDAENKREAINLKVNSCHGAHNYADCLDHGGTATSGTLVQNNLYYGLVLICCKPTISLCAQHPDYACQVLVLECHIQGSY